MRTQVTALERLLICLQNYLDRNNIATARLSGKVGMQADLNMTNSQYETSVSILFVGYILMQIPSNLFLNKLGKPALYLPAVMVRNTGNLLHR